MRVKGKKRISAPMGTNIKPTGRSISHERQAISGRYPIAVATLQSETGNNANNKEKKKRKRNADRKFTSRRRRPERTR